MSLGGKCVFATVMSLVWPMCIFISCSSVLCMLMALGMFMFVKVMSSLISVMSPPTCLCSPMCIFISCSSVLCMLMALGMFMFVKVMSSLISVMSPPTCLCSLSVRMVV